MVTSLLNSLGGTWKPFVPRFRNNLASVLSSSRAPYKSRLFLTQQDFRMRVPSDYLQVLTALELSELNATALGEKCFSDAQGYHPSSFNRILAASGLPVFS